MEPAAEERDRTRLRRRPERAVVDRETCLAFLDAQFVAHVAFVERGEAVCIPTTYARDGDRLLLHGSPASRLLTALAGGLHVCASVVSVDGLVVARAASHHSLDYRSVVVFGRTREVVGEEAKLAASRAIVEHVLPGRWAEARRPDARELRAVRIVELPLDELSGKRRAAPPADDPRDLGTGIWAGNVPLGVRFGQPTPSPDLEQGVPLPPSIAALLRADATR
jgi:nitroimidazol reductase NimA-like FMN-containing flavoprotein (pyridoxamine 5'-phosphate oxidase superfamily)